MTATAPQRTSYDLVVVGAGAVGLAAAWRAAQAGLSVLVVERDHAGAGASGVAAGMLAPVTEADFGEQDLLALNVEGRALWGAFAAELEAADRPARRLRRLGLPGGGRRPRRRGRAAPPARVPADAGPGGRVADAQRRARRWSRGCRRASAARSAPRTTARWSRARWWPRWRPRWRPRAASCAEGTEVAELTGDAGRVTGVRTAAGQADRGRARAGGLRRLERPAAVRRRARRARGAAGQGPAAGAARPGRPGTARRAAGAHAALLRRLPRRRPRGHRRHHRGPRLRHRGHRRRRVPACSRRRWRCCPTWPSWS